MAFFKFKDRLTHYSAVANGSKSTKVGSKYSEAEQRAYARGARDEMNRSRRILAYKNSTDLERAAYKNKKKAERDAWKASHK